MICRLEWGVDGVRRAAKRCDAIVIVDTLSFSTGVTAAVHAGAIIIPTADIAGARQLAESMGAELAVKRHEVSVRAQYSLSPETLQNAENGAKIVLPSPNGARCSLAARGSPVVCAGALVNAAAVARYVFEQVGKAQCDVTIVACGEAFDPYHPETSIRFALEDLLGAGAISSHLNCEESPEILAAQAAFEAAKPNLHRELLACESGRELIEMGYPQDVEIAAQIDSLSVVAAFDGKKYSRTD